MVWFSDSAASYIASNSPKTTASDSAFSRSSNGSNFSHSSPRSFSSDSASSRSSNGSNFSYSNSGYSGSYGQSHTSAPASYGPTVPQSFGSGKAGGLYGGAANALAGGYGQYQQPPSKSIMSKDAATNLIQGYEKFSSRPYYDVNAWRTGYGSDTLTAPDGTVSPVLPTSFVSKADAARDLARRIPQFQKGIINTIGQNAWDNLSIPQQSAVTSFAYNYGSLAKTPTLAQALKSGDPKAISKAIADRGVDNGGVNAWRRTSEANVSLKDSVPYSPKSNYVTVAQVPPIPPPVSPMGVLKPTQTLRAPSGSYASIDSAQSPRAPSGSFASIDNYPPLRGPSGSYASINNAQSLRGPSGSYASIDGAKLPAVAYGYGAYQNGPQAPKGLTTYTPPLRDASGSYASIDGAKSLRGPSGSYASIDNYPSLRDASGSYASIDNAQSPREPSGSYASIDGQTPQEQQYANSISGGFGMPGYGPGVVNAQQVANMKADPRYTDGSGPQVAAIGGQKIYDKPLTNPVPPLGPVESAAANVLLYPGAAHDIGGLRNEPSNGSNGMSFGNGNTSGTGNSQNQMAQASNKPKWQLILDQMNAGKSPQEQLANTFKVLSDPTLMYG